MERPTIADLAKAAEVSVSTVDRVLNGRDPVRRDKAERVLKVAAEIGFRATGALRQRLGPDRPDRAFGFLLQAETQSFYGMLGRALVRETRAAAAIRGDARVDFMEHLDSGAVAERLLKLGRSVDAIAVVTADHPRVTQAIEELRAKGIPVLALISDLTAQARAGYVGLDNWKVGRTAAWAVASLCCAPGRVAVIVGSHRFLCQDVSESGFRSYFREHAAGFTVMEPLTSLEETRFAYENTLDLLRRTPDLVGLYVTGGGSEGVLQALRDEGAARRIVTIGRELTPENRSGLIDGSLRMVLSHSLDTLARVTVDALAKATGASRGHGATTKSEPFQQILLPIDLATPESL